MVSLDPAVTRVCWEEQGLLEETERGLAKPSCVNGDENVLSNKVILIKGDRAGTRTACQWRAAPLLLLKDEASGQYMLQSCQTAGAAKARAWWCELRITNRHAQHFSVVYISHRSACELVDTEETAVKS